jgi:hypothetical protein
VDALKWQENSMNSKLSWSVGTGLLTLSAVMAPAQSAENSAADQKHQPLMIHRLYTGPDGQTHADEIEAKFVGGANAVYKLIANSGAELHRAPPCRVADWHTAPRRQYVITLSGHAELEVAGGKKIEIGPGDIDFVEDTTGKGHITRTVGSEDRVTIQIPVSDGK